jgi:TPR repeat protein
MTTCSNIEFALGTAHTLMPDAADQRRGAAIMRHLASLGHADGQVGYGICLSEGFGVGIDSPQAARWFAKSLTDHKHPHGAYELGVAFYTGEVGRALERVSSRHDVGGLGCV